MDRAELIELLSADGLALLDSLPPYTSANDVVHLVSTLRGAGHSPALVAAVLTQSRLRARATAKFGDFASRMLFTESGLEQATRLRVAALHAGRFAAAGIRHVTDLGCGIGGDAMAMAAIDLAVLAVEADELTAAIASYNLAPFPNAQVLHARAEDLELTDLGAFTGAAANHGADSGTEGAFLDPARRTAGHFDTRRLTNPNDYSPALDFAFGLAEKMPVGVKLGPGLDRDLIPREAEAQWVSVDGQLVEMGVWFGALARHGIRRSALVLNASGSHELNAPADSEDAGIDALGEYVYEPDGAVIRARLIGDLARSLNAHMISGGIAYLSADTLVSTPFASAFRVLEIFPLDERTLKQELRRRRVGVLEIKKRGVDVDPAQMRKRLSLRGSASATIILTRIAGRHTALLVERMPRRSGAQ